MIKIQKSPEKVWFSADIHHSHKNIIKGLSTWDTDGQREFDSVDHMNETIIGNINDCVAGDDLLILLGDTLFGEKDYVKFARNIKCENLMIMPGNHCHLGRLQEGYADQEYQLLSSYEEFKVGKQLINACHYPILSFNNMNRGSWMLYGHCHGSIMRSNEDSAKYFNSLKTLDVGIDNAFYLLGEYRPFNMANDIAPIMKDRDNNSELDHH